MLALAYPPCPDFQCPQLGIPQDEKGPILNFGGEFKGGWMTATVAIY